MKNSITEQRNVRILLSINLLSCVASCIILYLGCVNTNKFVRDTALSLFVLCLLLFLFYRYRRNENFIATTFFFPLFLVMLCISSFMLQTSVFLPWTLTHLELSPVLLLKYHQQTTSQYRHNFFQQYGRDGMLYRREPGSLNRLEIDNGAGFEDVMVTADETGYLNQDAGFYDRSPTIDIFFAGDSVLEGAGRYSCVNAIKKSTSCSIWNLSMGGYSPRQRCAAVMEFAVSKKPRLIVLDVYSGNDFSDANEDEIVCSVGHYTARFNPHLKRYLALQSEAYRDLLQPTSMNRLWIEHVRQTSLPLSLLNFIYQQAHLLLEPRGAERTAVGSAAPAKRLYAYPSSSGLGVLPQAHQRWVELGIQSALKSYAQLLDAVAGLDAPPKVVFLYNPTSYEIYRGISVQAEPEADRSAKLQVEAVMEFCRRSHVEFIDLTGYFRDYVTTHDGIWLYGAQDPIHWSREGNVVAGEILRKALADHGVFDAVGCGVDLTP